MRDGRRASGVTARETKADERPPYRTSSEGGFFVSRLACVHESMGGASGERSRSPVPWFRSVNPLVAARPE